MRHQASADHNERLSNVANLSFVAHYANADELEKNTTTTIRTENSVTTDYGDYTNLRAICHEREQAEQCFQDFMTYTHRRNNALRRAYSHSCYVGTRATVATVAPVVQTLAQVSATFAKLITPTSLPPGRCHALNVLATCHASNAPGLSLIANDIGRSSPPE